MNPTPVQQVPLFALPDERLKLLWQIDSELRRLDDRIAAGQLVDPDHYRAMIAQQRRVRNGGVS